MLRKAVDRSLKRYEGIFMFFRLLNILVLCAVVLPLADRFKCQLFLLSL